MEELNETYEFQIVEFILKGRKKGGQICLDIVPCSWLSANDGKLVCKFMPEPYHGEQLKMLHDMVQFQMAPLPDWPEYPVRLRSHAKSYKKAMRRLKKLEAEADYVYTSDTDTPPQKKAKLIEQNIKLKSTNAASILNDVMPIPMTNPLPINLDCVEHFVMPAENEENYTNSDFPNIADCNIMHYENVNLEYQELINETSTIQTLVVDIRKLQSKQDSLEKKLDSVLSKLDTVLNNQKNCKIVTGNQRHMFLPRMHLLLNMK